MSASSTGSSPVASALKKPPVNFCYNPVIVTGIQCAEEVPAVGMSEGQHNCLDISLHKYVTEP